MNAVRNAIDKSLAERDQNVDRFCSALDKDIADLGKQVKQVKQAAQVICFLFSSDFGFSANPEHYTYLNFRTISGLRMD